DWNGDLALSRQLTPEDLDFETHASGSRRRRRRPRGSIAVVPLFQTAFVAAGCSSMHCRVVLGVKSPTLPHTGEWGRGRLVRLLELEARLVRHAVSEL